MIRALTVENKGDGPFRRLRAWTLVDKNPLLDHREFIFGNVNPHEKRSWTVPLELPRNLDSRRDQVVFHFEEDGGRAPPDVTAAVDVAEAERPVFGFSVARRSRLAEAGRGEVRRASSRCAQGAQRR